MTASLLDRKTLAVLATARPAIGPVVKDADVWHAKHTVGAFKLYPRTDGKFAVADTRRPPMQMFLDGEVFDTEAKGHARLVALAKAAKAEPK